MAVCVMRAVIFLPIFLVSVEAKTEIRTYDSNIHVPVHGREEPISWWTPGILLAEFEHGYLHVIGIDQPHAPYLGQVIAGRAEFPWIVDVSNVDLVQEQNGIGNLVSSLWVVTAGHIYDEWSKSDECGPSESENYQVKFCTLYLKEDWHKWNEPHLNFDQADYTTYHLYEGRDDRGTRHIEQIVKHPLCTRFSREYDLMMLRLNVPIDPVPPEIGYMPILGRDPDQIVRVDVNALNGVVCYVATYGRPFRGLPHPVNLDYKTRYRAYPTDWKTCHNHHSHLCSFDGKYVDLNCEWFFDQGAEDSGGRQLVCFEMRNYNGAVCNHDQGAPVVCDGEVVGFVVRGAPFELCRSGSPYPFVVAKIDTFSGGFFTGKRLRPMTRPSTRPTPVIIELSNFTRKIDKEVNWQKYILK